MTESKNDEQSWQVLAVGFSVLLGMILFFDFFSISITPKRNIPTRLTESASYSTDSEIGLRDAVLPKEGVELPVVWGDLGKRLMELGVIDADKLESLYAQRGGLDEETQRLIGANDTGSLVITEENANALLNLLWAFGLANENRILAEGPMMDPQYGGDAGRFASTGGWTLAAGSVMDHYNKHQLVTLTETQQELVELVSKNIYRPCCGNSTYFPDCNHGMAMLGLLELMASQGVGEQEMYQIALKVNSYWFPDTYLTIATYLEHQGISWLQADPKLVLGESFSSAAGYARILSEVDPVQSGGGGSCGV
ncbi:MAG: hypothetical protein Q8Q38_00785 [bacterium]|nr:hypothetical protein [bacterium]